MLPSILYKIAHERVGEPIEATSLVHNLNVSIKTIYSMPLSDHAPLTDNALVLTNAHGNLTSMPMYILLRLMWDCIRPLH